MAKVDFKPIKLRAREYGVSLEKLAASVGIDPAQLEKWERTGRIPPFKEHLLQGALWSLRAQAVARSEGLEPCEEFERLAASQVPVKVYAAHTASCAVCQQRDAYLQSVVGPPPRLSDDAFVPTDRAVIVAGVIVGLVAGIVLAMRGAPWYAVPAGPLVGGVAAFVFVLSGGLDAPR